MSARILVADPHPDTSTALLDILQQEHYEVIPVPDGTAILQHVATDPPHIILLDPMITPGPDGYEVCRRIKNNPNTEHIQVVLLVRDLNTDVETRSVATGADHVLLIPVSKEVLTGLIQAHLKMHTLTRQLIDTEHVIFMLARAIETRDQYSGRHLQRLADYSAQLAEEVGVPIDDIQAIRYAAILHDLGKIRVRESILTKPGPLTLAELAEFRRHPEYGAEMIARMRFSDKVVPIVLSRNEQWDGNGYPHGLSGEDIPIGARIVAIVDSFEAMTSNRPHRPALSEHEALRRLRAGRRVQWDPALVDTFHTMVEQGKFRPTSPSIYPEEHI